MSTQHLTLSKGRNFTIESFDIVAVCLNKVECCFDKVERCFDIVAGVNRALEFNIWPTWIKITPWNVRHWSSFDSQASVAKSRVTVVVFCELTPVFISAEQIRATTSCRWCGKKNSTMGANLCDDKSRNATLFSRHGRKAGFAEFGEQSGIATKSQNDTVGLLRTFVVGGGG